MWLYSSTLTSLFLSLGPLTLGKKASPSLWLFTPLALGARHQDLVICGFTFFKGSFLQIPIFTGSSLLLNCSVIFFFIIAQGGFKIAQPPLSPWMIFPKLIPFLPLSIRSLPLCVIFPLIDIYICKFSQYVLPVSGQSWLWQDHPPSLFLLLQEPMMQDRLSAQEPHCKQITDTFMLQINRIIECDRNASFPLSFHRLLCLPSRLQKAGSRVRMELIIYLVPVFLVSQLPFFFQVLCLAIFNVLFRFENNFHFSSFNSIKSTSLKI